MLKIGSVGLTVNKNVVKNNLDEIILGLLDSKSQHGYSLTSTLKSKYGFTTNVTTIYPLLNRLERKGYIKSEWINSLFSNEKPRKVFTITDKGKIYLNEYKKELILVIQGYLE